MEGGVIILEVTICYRKGNQSIELLIPYLKSKGVQVEERTIPAGTDPTEETIKTSITNKPFATRVILTDITVGDKLGGISGHRMVNLYNLLAGIEGYSIADILLEVRPIVDLVIASGKIPVAILDRLGDHMGFKFSRNKNELSVNNLPLDNEDLCYSEILKKIDVKSIHFDQIKYFRDGKHVFLIDHHIVRYDQYKDKLEDNDQVLLICQCCIGINEPIFDRIEKNFFYTKFDHKIKRLSEKIIKIIDE